MRLHLLTIITFALTVFGFICCGGQPNTSEGPGVGGRSLDGQPGSTNSTVKDFESYRVKVSQDEPVDVELGSHPKADIFRTRLEEAMDEGVNFAGKYVFASWGCGSGCAMGAIIDATNGKVYFPKELDGMGFGIAGEPVADEPIEYRKDSSLLIIRGVVGGEEEEGVTYLEWDGEEFKTLLKEKS